VLEEILGNVKIKSTSSLSLFLNFFCTSDSRFCVFVKYTNIGVPSAELAGSRNKIRVLVLHAKLAEEKRDGPQNKCHYI
jgi:hypothetical protein